MSMAIRWKSYIREMVSIKVVLIISFIVLMAISGVLGFILTYFQSKQSLNDVAEISMNEASYSLVQSVTAKLTIGHQMNKFEAMFFANRNMSMTNWVNAYYIWKYLSLQNLMKEIKSYGVTTLIWYPNHALSFAPAIPGVVLVNFNTTVCNDTVNFPGSNCSFPYNWEAYLFNTKTGEFYWNRVLFFRQVDYTQLTEWKYSALMRSTNWRASDDDPYNYGYTPVFNTASNPTFLCIELTIALPDASGAAFGSLGKNLQLDFVNTLLSTLVQSNPLLNVGGRAFVYEQKGLGFIGASHGKIYLQLSCPTCEFGSTVDRYRVDRSTDVVTATTGKLLVDAYTRSGTIPGKFIFTLGDSLYLHISRELSDDFGLRWMVSVVLSLTELFKDITSASMRMLAITAGVIVAMSVIASLGITFAVLRPLQQLSEDMESVSTMRLEEVDPKKSWFKEISLMQGYFVDMVAKLVEYRAFLPEAILNNGSETASLVDPEENEDKLFSKTKVEDNRRVTVVSGGKPSRYEASGRKSLALGLAPPPPVTPTSTNSPRSGRESSDSHGSKQLQQNARKKSTGTALSSSRKSHDSRRKSMGHLVLQLGGLTQRYVSCMQVDMKDFHRMLEEEVTVTSAHSEVMEIVMQGVQQQHGMCNPLLGDKIVAFWNVKNAKADHAVLCATAAMQISSSIAKIPANGEQPKSVRIACTSGTAMFGSMGTKTSRSFTILSTCIPRGFFLQKLSKLMPFSVACDCAMQERITYRFNTRLVGVLPKPVPESTSPSPSPTAPEKIYEVLCASEANVDEWMYELQQKESQQSKNADFELGVRALYSGNESSALQYFKSFEASHSSDMLTAWYSAHTKEVLAMLNSQLGFMVPSSLFH